MSGMSHLEPKFRGMRRNNPALVKVEEKRLQKLLDFIDSRMQDQRSKIRRQIEETQQTADEMEEKKHKATLQMLKNYFEVTSGRVNASNSQFKTLHEERMMGVLSEPSLAVVPEVDPDVLAKPRSMYDRITRGMATTRLPALNNGMRTNMVSGSKSMPTSMPNSTRSDDENSTPFVLSPRSTPSNNSENGEVIDEPAPKPVKIEIKDKVKSSLRRNGSNYAHQRALRERSPSPSSTERVSSINQNGLTNGHVGRTKYGVPSSEEIYQRGTVKPMSHLPMYKDQEIQTPRLGDLVESKHGLTRHSSLNRRSLCRSNMSMSTVSLSELQPTRKQQAASKLKTALKTVRIPR